MSDDELRRVWQAAGDAGAFGGMVRMLLLTGQRREKVANMRWSDVSPDGVWSIPRAPREKGTPGSLVLPEAALAIIRVQPRFASNPHVFAGIGPGAANNFGRCKKSLDEASSVTGWTLHDLRRTARSLMVAPGCRANTPSASSVTLFAASRASMTGTLITTRRPTRCAGWRPWSSA